MLQLFSILFNSQLFVNTFTLTFIAEWGDRSQLATIVLAGINDVVRNKIVTGYQSVSVPINLIFDIDIKFDIIKLRSIDGHIGI